MVFVGFTRDVMSSISADKASFGFGHDSIPGKVESAELRKPGAADSGDASKRAAGAAPGRESPQARRAEERSGIVAAHCDRLQELASRKQICIAIRPVNKAASALIRAGFGTKDMAIKGKSSNIPPLSGLVPRDQLLGKKSNKPAEAAKLQQKNEDSIANRSATAVRLTLPAEHLRTMEGLTVEGTWLNESNRLNEKPADGSPRSGLMRGTDPATGREHTFFGEWQEDGTVGVFLAREENGALVKGEQVEVMGNRSGKAVTADYDLAFVAPRIEDYASEHTLPVKITSPEELQARRGRSLSESDKNDYLRSAAGGFVNTAYEPSEALDDGRQTPEKSLGNISGYTRNLIPDLNAACGVGEGQELFHHGDDAGNPWTVEDDNYPMTVILPDSDAFPPGTDRIRTIENHDELKALYQTLKNSDFLPPSNFGWGQDIADVRSERFSRARDDLELALRHRPSPDGEGTGAARQRSNSAPARLSSEVEPGLEDQLREQMEHYRSDMRV